MSRTAVTGQLTTPSQGIFITEITQQDGTKTRVMSTRPLCDSSIRINSRDNKGPLFLLITLYVHGNVICRNMVFDVWGKILEFSLGEPLGSLGSYAVAIRRPSLFSAIEMNPFVIVDAAMRGQEDMVINILSTDPSYLLRKAKVKNSVNVEHEVTPLQAAMMVNDIQMTKKMRAHFARLTTDLHGNPIDGLSEMQSQIKAIYTESLQRYCDIQKEKIAALNSQQNNEESIDLEALQTAQTCLELYSDALQQDDIHTIIKIHNQAQEHNAFDFQPYVDAILNATRAELDDVMALIDAKTPEETIIAIARTGVAATQSAAASAKSFDKLTLVEKLNRFREEFVKHMQQEIIFNPHHILVGTRWNVLAHTANLDDEKRSIIFSQLLGWAQRNAAEPVKQDIRQGTWHLVEKNELRTRPSCFNYYNSDIARNSHVDVSAINSSSIDGLGYKFANDSSGRAATQWHGPIFVPIGQWHGPIFVSISHQLAIDEPIDIFLKLMSSKNSMLSKLIRSTPKIHSNCCVIS